MSLFFSSVKTFLMVFVSLLTIASITLTAPYADFDFPSSESNNESWYSFTAFSNYTKSNTHDVNNVFSVVFDLLLYVTLSHDL